MEAEELGPSLRAAFARVPHVRSRHGRRYPLPAAEPPPDEPFILDGKGLRGLHGEESPGVRLVAVYAAQASLVLAVEAHVCWPADLCVIPASHALSPPRPPFPPNSERPCRSSLATRPRNNAIPSLRGPTGHPGAHAFAGHSRRAPYSSHLDITVFRIPSPQEERPHK